MMNDKRGNARARFGGRGDKFASCLIFVFSMAGILLMVFILAFLAANGLPVLKETSLAGMLLGFDWYPVEDPPALGMLPLIVGTMAVTLLASITALPVAFMLAVFTAEIVPRWMRSTIKVLLELLGFIPSIVIGFLGMMIVAPWMQETFNVASGLNLLTASVLLGFLVIPTVASLSEEALFAVPFELRDASYALGATRWETIRQVVIPYALPGISSSALLGVMRSLGETMIVLMVAGGAAIIPHSPVDPVRPLTSTIAAEMGETPVGSTHYHALFFAGFLLLLITIVINLTSYCIEKRGLTR